MINASFYIFGNFGRGCGHTQYPNDYTADLFQKFSTIRPDSDRIIVYRKENLVYHCIIHKAPMLNELSYKVHFGFCIVTNGMRFTDSASLQSVFESLLTHLLEREQLLKRYPSGDIRFLDVSQDRICTERESLEKFLLPQLANIDGVYLPPISFSSQNGTVRIVDGINESTELNNEDTLVILCDHKFLRSVADPNHGKQINKEQSDKSWGAYECRRFELHHTKRQERKV